MIGEIWSSFRRMPGWVQVWVAFILMPANLLPLVFLGHPMAGWIAGLSVGGMALNMPILFASRGFSKAMALPHVLLWTPLVILLVLTLMRGEASGLWYVTLWLLLGVDVISLAFDYVDSWHWWRGDRQIA